MVFGPLSRVLAESLYERLINAWFAVVTAIAGWPLAAPRARGRAQRRAPRPPRRRGPGTCGPPPPRLPASDGDGRFPGQPRSDHGRALRAVDADELIAADTIGGAKPNAADFQIATAVRVLVAFDDLGAAVRGRPAEVLARRLLPSYPEPIPRALPASG
jgi:hypothetical protein